MTRKDFERIAQVFRVNRRDSYNRQWLSLLDDMCVELQVINPRFNEETFRKACNQ